jgi:tRNA G37 N-methylase Trm5
LAKTLKQDGNLYAFDISNEAVENTKKLLKENSISTDNIKIINDSHENKEKYIADKKIKAALFNLGYLPKSTKALLQKQKALYARLRKY